MRILITGSTGFVGSALGPRLIEAGHELFCVCRPQSFASFGETVHWDPTQSRALPDFPNNIEGIIHLAQSRRYRTFPADARELFDVNVAMTMTLLEWAARSRVRHFCLVSSGSVYEPFTGALHEDVALSPCGFLGASKLASENIARPFGSLFKLITMRLFFPFGPGQTGRLIPDLIGRVRQGEAVQVGADGEGMHFTPTFVEDVVDVLLASMHASWTGTVNVATPETVSIRQVAQIIGRNLGIQPRIEIVAKRAVDVVPNLERLADRFDMKRFTRFEDGLRKTLD